VWPPRQPALRAANPPASAPPRRLICRVMCSSLFRPSRISLWCRRRTELRIRCEARRSPANSPDPLAPDHVGERECQSDRPRHEPPPRALGGRRRHALSRRRRARRGRATRWTRRSGGTATPSAAKSITNPAPSPTTTPRNAALGSESGACATTSAGIPTAMTRYSGPAMSFGPTPGTRPPARPLPLGRRR